MHVLVFNGGSSSLNYKVFRLNGEPGAEVILKGKAHRVGVKGIEDSFIESAYAGQTERRVMPIPDHRAAAVLAAEDVVHRGIRVDAVGHRFVHGGEHFKTSALLDSEGMKKIRKCLRYAPLHNPLSYDVILEARKVFKDAPHYVVIDSAFHATIPPVAYTYAIPRSVANRFNFRRFGFHGISYSYICHKVPDLLGVDLKTLNMIVCHLGTGGASIMAVREGVSVDTSMGFSPNTGLIMSTRSGDIDPEVILHLVEKEGLSPGQVEEMLNGHSGLRGVSGFSSDITDIIAKVNDDAFRDRAQLALDMYLHRLKRYIGSYIMTLQGKVDALVFTDDIGVGNALIREKVCGALTWAGIVIDETINRKAPKDAVTFLQAAASRTAIVSMPTEEELMICLEGKKILGRGCHAAVGC